MPDRRWQGPLPTDLPPGTWIDENATTGGADPAAIRRRFTGALLRAAYDGDLEGVKTALAQGADIAASDPKTGLCPLHLAIGTNNLPLARYLIEEAKAPIVPDGFGRWPTVIAAECCVSEELCDYIVEKEAAAVAAAK